MGITPFNTDLFTMFISLKTLQVTYPGSHTKANRLITKLNGIWFAQEILPLSLKLLGDGREFSKEWL